MQYPLKLEGFEGHNISVESQGITGRAKIYFDGLPAKEGPKKGEFILQRDDGFKIIARVRPRPFDVVPKVMVDGKQVAEAESLPFYQVIWSALPIFLFLIGGLIGGFIGAFAFWFNLKVFRSDIHPVEKYVLSGSVSAIAVLIVTLLLFFLAYSIAGG
jgi:hypothetical protein